MTPKEQKVIITNDHGEINVEIRNGWRVTFVVAQLISSASRNGDWIEREGKFCFVLEK